MITSILRDALLHCAKSRFFRNTSTHASGYMMCRKCPNRMSALHEADKNGLKRRDTITSMVEAILRKSGREEEVFFLLLFSVSSEAAVASAPSLDFNGGLVIVARS